jgi:predicted extracellular nuclease
MFLAICAALRLSVPATAITALLLVNPAGAQDIAVSQIQGPDHNSPLAGGTPVTTEGIVTGRFGKGFFMQAEQPDGDARTAEGVFVFLPAPDSFPAFDVGSVVRVTGRPVEFKPFIERPIMSPRTIVACGTLETSEIEANDRERFRPITELAQVSALEVLGTAPLPDPVAFSPPGATSPIAFADQPNTPFDPAAHPRDYFESLEHMRVVIPDALVVSRKESSWDQFSVVSAAHLSPDEVTPSGLPRELHGHVFPEIIQVHKANGQPALKLAPGTRLGDLTGIMTYENGNYMVVLDEKIDPATIEQPGAPEPAPSIDSAGVRIATYNAQNLSAATPDSKFALIARQIVDQLGAPDVLALQEIQDDDGPEITPVVSAGQTLAKLVAAISAAGGPDYVPVSLDPVQPNTDGGEPGGNIRTAFLVRDGSAATLGVPERLFDGEDRCGDDNPFAQTRRPLLVEMMIGGERYVLVNLHLSSKLGDEGLYSIAEDPQPGSTAARLAQTAALAAVLEDRYDPEQAKIILLGDFNDHADADSLKPLRDSAFGFTFRRDSRGENFTFSHEFGGLRGAIDHIVTSQGIAADSVPELFYLNLNADVLDRASDHNPVMAIIQ